MNTQFARATHVNPPATQNACRQQSQVCDSKCPDYRRWMVVSLQGIWGLKVQGEQVGWDVSQGRHYTSGTKHAGIHQFWCDVRMFTPFDSTDVSVFETKLKNLTFGDKSNPCFARLMADKAGIDPKLGCATHPGTYLEGWLYIPDSHHTLAHTINYQRLAIHSGTYLKGC